MSLQFYDPKYRPDILEFEFICRICMKKGSLQSIFEYRDHYKPLELIDLSDKIRLCSDINIETNDDLPGSICEKCVNILYIAHHFKIFSENNDRILRDILNNAKELGITLTKNDFFSNNSRFELEDSSVLTKDNIILKSEPIEHWDLLDSGDKNVEPFEIFNFNNEFREVDDVLKEFSYFESEESSQTDESDSFDDSESEYLSDDDSVLESDGKVSQTSSVQEKQFSEAIKSDSSDDDSLANIPLKYFAKQKPPDENKNNDDEAIEEPSYSSVNDETFKLMKDDLSCYGCLVCGFQFRKKLSLDKHMLVKHGDSQNDFKCYGCDKKFKSRLSRLQHEKNDCPNLSPGTKYQCSKCPCSFDNRTDLDAHLKVHQVGTQPAPARTLELQPLHKCPHCPHTSNTTVSLKAHIRSKHSNEKPFVCEKCGKAFFTHATLYSHKVIHSDVKKHKCSYCPYAAKLRSALLVHERRHTKTYPFTCDICGRHLMSSSSLARHIRTHNPVKEFQCEQCDKAFSYKDSLVQHVSSFHMGLKPHVCSFCECAYARKKDLKKHLKRCHMIVTTSNRIQPVKFIDKKNSLNEIT